MGVAFRSGGYTKFVRIGGRTIKDGEAAAIWNRSGEHSQIVGPKRILMFYSTIRFLTRFKAEADQYLKIQHRDGTVEHLQGPVQMYLNPSFHDTISVNDGIKLKENEVIQVSHLPMLKNEDIAYNTDGTAVEKDESLVVKKSKRFVLGPALFIPAEDEIVEEFSWSGLPEETCCTLNYGSGDISRFKKIQLHTKRVWSVKVPIGSGSAKVHASLAITYTIDSIDKVTMHSDPCAFICGALMGDIQDLLSEDLPTVKSAADFRSIQTKVTYKMSGSKSFPNLMGTGEAIGFSIDSIQVLEVTPGSRMQKQLATEHEREMRMNAQVANKESEIKFQELELEERRKKMENEIELSRKEAKMQADLAEELHVQKVSALTQEQEMTKIRKQENLGSLKASDALVLEFLGNLKELGVDMSKYLCTEAGNKASRKIIDRAPSLATYSNPATFSDSEERKE
ncbi:unnamed protein product [Cylindrotheca closterium]|uniref:Uncharacterized protein n=1 Tax=Cylindrotheca closterium TaxID=2856 RepID=A0AAD2G218_9STRA|nr:unnamed protein product [Cylindrotheca closterium]